MNEKRPLCPSCGKPADMMHDNTEYPRVDDPTVKVIAECVGCHLAWNPDHRDEEAASSR